MLFLWIKIIDWNLIIFFTNLPLLQTLQQNGILAIGTIRNNRLKGCQNVLKTERQLNLDDHGSFDWSCETTKHINVVRWFDIVQLASNYILYSKETSTFKRYFLSEHIKVDIYCPKLVGIYNNNMGGVDTCDRLISYYRVGMKTIKWYRHFLSFG